MNFSSSAPVRQPVPELPERDLPVAPGPEETPQGAGSSLVHLQFLWQHRRMLARAVLYGFFASTLVAFIIPARYESTARLMPPDSSQSGGLAMAAWFGRTCLRLLKLHKAPPSRRLWRVSTKDRKDRNALT